MFLEKLKSTSNVIDKWRRLRRKRNGFSNSDIAYEITSFFKNIFETNIFRNNGDGEYVNSVTSLL
jgi:hypothetical protein